MAGGRGIFSGNSRDWQTRIRLWAAFGDGILAYFGMDTDAKTACMNSLLAARRMARKLDEVNMKLKNSLSEPLEIGIGIHFGGAILGEVGYKKNVSMTIIGDTVNTASRFEGLNKAAKSRLIFSSTVLKTAGTDSINAKRFNVIIRGKKDPVEIYSIIDIDRELTGLSDPNVQPV